MKNKIIIGLPVYNEESGIPKLLEKIILIRQKLGKDLQLYIVNDGSTDTTEKILHKYCKRYAYMNYINHPKNKGLGEAVKTLMNVVTFSFSEEDILVILDADNTHDPKIILDMVDKLNQENLDVVVASRFASGGKEIGVPIIRKTCSRGARIFFKTFFNIKNINDYSCGFRLYKVGYLKKAMTIYQNNLVTTSGFECMAEILAKFSKIGVKAGEYPLVLDYSLKESASKMRILKTTIGYFNLLGKVKKPKNFKRVKYG